MRFVGLLLVALTACGVAPVRRANIVLLVSDDQGWADIGFHNPRVWSPHLDQLARTGVTFTQHYVMPQCTPSRVALLTGRYPSRFGGAAMEASNGPVLPAGTATIATELQRAGYATHLCGKWHLGNDATNAPGAFGFATSYGSLAGAIGMYDHRYRPGPYEHTWHRNGELVPGAENGTHATDLVADDAVAFLSRAGKQPFFLYVPFHSVHTPLDERGRFVHQPTQLDPQHPGRWRHEDQIEWFHDPQGRIQREPDPEKRLLLAAVHHLDAAVGRIVQALERQQLRENTLIVFLSDNGPQTNWAGGAYPDDLHLTDFNQPLPMRGIKLDVYEGGVHVPAFAHWPGRIAARQVTDPVHAVDWLPTLLAMVGAAGVERADGLNLWPALQGEPLPTRDLYFSWGRTTNRWALRSGEWKIVHYGKRAPVRADQWQLFHLPTDPREQANLAKSEPERCADLHRRFLQQREFDAN